MKKTSPIVMVFAALVCTTCFCVLCNAQSFQTNTKQTNLMDIYEQPELNNGLIAFFGFDNTLTSKNATYTGLGQRDGKVGYTTDRFGNDKCALLVSPNAHYNGMSVNFTDLLLPSRNKAISYNFWVKSSRNRSPLMKELFVNSVDFFDQNKGTGGFSLGISSSGYTPQILLYTNNNTNSVYGDDSYMNNKLVCCDKYSFSDLDIMDALDNNWHMVTYVIADTLLEGWVDGVNVLETAKDFSLTKFQPFNQNFKLRIPGEASFEGSIDDIGIYDRKLSSRDINRLLRSYKNGDRFTILPDTIPSDYLKNQKFWFNRIIAPICLMNSPVEIKSFLRKKGIGLKFVPDYFYYSLYDRFGYDCFVNTALETKMATIKAKRTDDKMNADEKEKNLAAIETKRITYLKKASIGDLMVYTQDWQKSESYLMGFFKKSTPYTMIVKCYIERIEGEKFQVRVADVSSSNSSTYATPEIGGIKISRGDIIWIKPYKDRNWFWGEDE